MDEVVHDRRPLDRGCLVAVVVRHAASRGGKQRHVGLALALQRELTLLDRLADLIIGDDERRWVDAAGVGLEGRDLIPSPLGKGWRRGRVVAVNIDVHKSPKISSSKRRQPNGMPA